MQSMIFQQMVNEDAGCISYLIGCSQAGEAIVVDPGRDRVEDYGAWARRKGLTLTHIVETHIHADHLSGNQALAAKTGARIHIHPAAEAAYAHAPITDGEAITIGTVRIQAVHTPGHTPGSTCFLLADRTPPILFSGDTLFRRSVGRTDLWGGDTDTILASIREKLFALAPETRVVCGHGPDTTIGEECLSNPFAS